MYSKERRCAVATENTPTNLLFLCPAWFLLQLQLVLLPLLSLSSHLTKPLSPLYPSKSNPTQRASVRLKAIFPSPSEREREGVDSGRRPVISLAVVTKFLCRGEGESQRVKQFTFNCEWITEAPRPKSTECCRMFFPL